MRRQISPIGPLARVSRTLESGARKISTATWTQSAGTPPEMTFSKERNIACRSMVLATELPSVGPLFITTPIWMSSRTDEFVAQE